MTGRPEPEDDAVPGAARLVRDFVNTREPQVDAERWHSPEGLRSWLADRHLVPAETRLDTGDLATAIAIREGLRAVLLGHAGHLADPAAIDSLNRALHEEPLRISFGEDGYRLVSATDTPFGEAVGQLADAIRQSGQDGTWPRLKVCARDTCRWAFYDQSRNQVRRWCSMTGCGNHIKMQRAYRSRRNRQQVTAPEGSPS